MREEYKGPVQVFRRSARSDRKGQVQGVTEQGTWEATRSGWDGAASPKDYETISHSSSWPYLQVSWVQLTSVSTEVFMGHAAPFQEVRYL